VHAGELRELLLRWPAPGLDAWTLQPPEGLTVSDATDESTQFVGELQRIEFAEPRSATFNVRLQYQRPLKAGPFELALPAMVCERTLPTWLVLRGVDAVEPRLDEAPGVAPLTESGADDWLRAQNFAADRDRAYRLTAPVAPLAGATQVFPREVAARTTISVERDATDRWRISQRVATEVKYGRVVSLSLNWPATFPAGGRQAGALAVHCRTDSGQALPVTESAGQLVVTLPAPLQGEVPVVLEFLLPATSDLGGERLDVPIFTLMETPFSSTLVEFPASDDLRIEPVDNAWQPVLTALTSSWMTTQPVTAFSAAVAFDVAGAPQQYHVDSEVARVAFDPAGRSRVRVDYSILHPPARLVVDLPGDAEALQVAWNGVRVQTVRSDPVGDANRRCEVALPAGTARDGGWLTMEYQCPGSAPLDALTRVRAILPRLPDSAVVQEAFVEVGVPADYCLLNYPRGLAPLFRWQPGLIFQRDSSAALAQLAQRLRASGAPPAATAFWQPDGADHTYAFWSPGPGSEVSIRAIRLWMLILMGSGLTLAVAFLLWTLPATRNVMTLLVLGCAVAVAGVFAPEVVELLLQPMLLGAAAAVIAVSLQVRHPLPPLRPIRRREENSTRSEQPRAGERTASAAAGVRDRLENGSRS
jgi:hypothetical protein